MENISKGERFNVYVLALFIFKKSLKEPFRFGICNAMSEAITVLNRNTVSGINIDRPVNTSIYPNPYDHMECYPEIYKYKPANNYVYWFDRYSKEGADKRIAILEEAIKLTKD